MIVGTEWLIEVFEADAERLREISVMREIFDRIIKDLNLKTVGEINWHKFGGAGGVTGLAMLTESHLACHTYPEHKSATFNLYCCRTRPEWNWKANLKRLLGANEVQITKIERGRQMSDVGCRMSEAAEIRQIKDNIPKSKIQNPKSKVAGGKQ